MTWRQTWVKAIKSDAFPVREHRPIRSTLLLLAGAMDIDGYLTCGRDRMMDVTGLPQRTVDRHLNRAVEAGWLIREQAGNRGTFAVYRAAYPVQEARQKWHPLEGESAPSTTRFNGAESAPSGGALNKTHPSASEDIALNSHPARQNNCNGSRSFVARDRSTEDGSAGRSAARSSSMRLCFGTERDSRFRRHSTTAGRSRPSHSLAGAIA